MIHRGRIAENNYFLIKTSKKKCVIETVSISFHSHRMVGLVHFSLVVLRCDQPHMDAIYDIVFLSLSLTPSDIII